jgi:O-antigen ligase
MTIDRIQKIFSMLFLTQLASLMLSLAAAQILYALLLVSGIFLLIKTKEYHWTVVDTVVSLFVLVRILSIVFSEYPAVSNSALFREVVFYPYYFLASLYYHRTGHKGIRSVILTLGYSSAVVSLIAIIRVMAGISERGTSFTSGYMTLATHLSLAIALLLPYVLYGEKRERLLYFAPAVVIMLGGLLATFSRGAWVAVSIMLFISLFTGKRKIGYLVGILVLVFVLAIEPLRERIFSLGNPFGNDTGRFALWARAGSLLFTHPFLGFGPQSFGVLLNDRTSLADVNVSSWHNDFIQITIESGLGGFLLAVVLMILLLIAVYRSSLRRRESEKFRIYSYCLLFSAIGILFDNLLQGIYFSVLNAFLLKIVWAFSGYVLGGQSAGYTAESGEAAI